MKNSNNWNSLKVILIIAVVVIAGYFIFKSISDRGAGETGLVTPISTTTLSPQVMGACSPTNHGPYTGGGNSDGSCSFTFFGSTCTTTTYTGSTTLCTVTNSQGQRFSVSGCNLDGGLGCVPYVTDSGSGGKTGFTSTNATSIKTGTVSTSTVKPTTTSTTMTVTQ